MQQNASEYEIRGLKFANKQVCVNFAAFFILMIVAPIGTFYIVSDQLRFYKFPDNQIEMYSGLSAVGLLIFNLFIHYLNNLTYNQLAVVNLIMILYCIVVITDKDNFKYEQHQLSKLSKKELQEIQQKEIYNQIEEVTYIGNKQKQKQKDQANSTQQKKQKDEQQKDIDDQQKEIYSIKTDQKQNQVNDQKNISEKNQKPSDEEIDITKYEEQNQKPQQEEQWQTVKGISVDDKKKLKKKNKKLKKD